MIKTEDLIEGKPVTVDFFDTEDPIINLKPIFELDNFSRQENIKKLIYDNITFVLFASYLVNGMEIPKSNPYYISFFKRNEFKLVRMRDSLEKISNLTHDVAETKEYIDILRNRQKERILTETENDVLTQNEERYSKLLAKQERIISVLSYLSDKQRRIVMTEGPSVSKYYVNADAAIRAIMSDDAFDFTDKENNAFRKSWDILKSDIELKKERSAQPLTPTQTQTPRK